MTQEEYDKLALQFEGQNWNYREELIKYCKRDCEALYYVLKKYNELIFGEFSVNIHKSPTQPSLSMRIFKSQYMPDNLLYQLNGEIEAEIRQSYTGGAVDVYRMHNRKEGDFNNKNTLYLYDKNSQFPTMMCLPLPVKVNLLHLKVTLD